MALDVLFIDKDFCNRVTDLENMRIEHWGYQVADPAAAAQWYCEHLGFTVKRVNQDKAMAHFLADESGQVMIEVYCNPRVAVPDYKNMDPLIWHLAFACKDVPGAVKALQSAGAVVVSPAETIPSGDTLAMLRDPWGVPVQLCDRAEVMCG